jgi:hypothetical protein
MEELEQNIKMKLQANAHQVRKYTDRCNHYQKNKLFIEDAKKFYCQINNQKAGVQEPPTRQQTEHYFVLNS